MFEQAPELPVHPEEEVTVIVRTVVCRGCDSSFSYEREGRGANRVYCDECGGLDESAGRRKRIRHLTHRYGLSITEYDAMLERCGGRCEACGEFPSGDTPRQRILHVDHDHATGRIRGLICYRCNQALGYAGEDLTRLRRLIIYLETS